MEGSAVARALTTRAAVPVVRPVSRAKLETYILGVAGAGDRGDDAAIRRLLRGTAFGDEIKLSLEREPDSSLAAGIEGDLHQAIVARHRSGGDVAAVASRSVREAFVNGKPSRLGYLGQLRIDPRFRRHRGLLDAGFAFCRQLHLTPDGGGASIYLASVVADNEPAMRLLARRVPGWPTFEPVESFVTLAIPARPWIHRRQIHGLSLAPASSTSVSDLADFLDRCGRRAQFFPRWSVSDLTSPTRSRGLGLDDFVVALHEDRIVGSLACWDQRAFKQVVVRGYSSRLARWRRAVNMLAPLTGTPTLPAIGTQLQFAYLSHFALADDVEGEEVAILMIDAARQRAASKGLDYVTLGMSSRSPLLNVLKRRFRHRAYESVLYVAFWPDGEALATSLDSRYLANPELGIL